MLGAGSDAEDAAQETVLRAYRAIEAGTRPTHLEAWLTTIAKREAYRLHERRQPADSLDGLSPPEHPGLVSADHSAETIDKLMAHELIAKAGPQDRVLLLQRFLLDRTTAEIAVELDMPHATVRVRLHRVLKSLGQIE